MTRNNLKIDLSVPIILIHDNVSPRISQWTSTLEYVYGENSDIIIFQLSLSRTTQKYINYFICKSRKDCFITCDLGMS